MTSSNSYSLSQLKAMKRNFIVSGVPFFHLHINNEGFDSWRINSKMSPECTNSQILTAGLTQNINPTTLSKAYESHHWKVIGVADTMFPTLIPWSVIVCQYVAYE
jgi:hypothetical protein